MTEFRELVSAVRIGGGMTKESFARGLNEYLPVDETLSGMAVSYWEQGLYTPVVSRLFWIYTHAPEGSWQRAFAERGMAIRNGKATGKGEPTDSNAFAPQSVPAIRPE